MIFVAFGFSKDVWGYYFWAANKLLIGLLFKFLIFGDYFNGAYACSIFSSIIWWGS